MASQRLRCEICNKMFATKKNLQRHQVVHSEERPFVHDACGKAFKHKKNLQAHVSYCKKTVSKSDQGRCRDLTPAEKRYESVENEIFQCEICSKTFATKQNLQRHHVVHSEERPFVHDACGKAFKHKKNLRAHLTYCKKTVSKHDQGKCRDFTKNRSFENENFQCEICNKTFTTKRNLQRHQVVHSDERPFVHDACGKTFKHKKNLQAHLSYCKTALLQDNQVNNRMPGPTDATGRPVCLICNMSFASQQNLDRHAVVHSDERPFVHEECGTKFKRKKALKEHMKTCTGPKVPGTPRPKKKDGTRYPCTLCSESYSTEQYLKMHMGTHDGTNPFYCEECNKFFLRKSHYEVHMNRHKGIASKCSKCDKSFVDQYVLKRHSQMCGAPPEERPRCDVCNERFATYQTLRKHMVVHSEARPFVCNKCGKSFRRSKDLTGHNKTCKTEFKCKVCEEQFLDKYLLADHVKDSHPGYVDPSRHACSHCPKTFASRQDHRMHEKIHTGENPHYCEICDRHFLKANKLKLHNISHHSGEKQKKPLRLEFPCSRCDTVLRTKRDLTMHERIHDGTNPYHCAACDMYFLKKISLAKHCVYAHTSNSDFRCSHCGKGFKFSSDLKRHESLHVKVGKQDLKCRTCALNFTTVSTLKAHLAQSPSCYSVSCSICQQKFPTPRALTRHMGRIHTVESPIPKRSIPRKYLWKQPRSATTFKCNQCDKSFRQAYQLKLHERSHVASDIHLKCIHCSELFTDLHAFNVHLQQHIDFTTAASTSTNAEKTSETHQNSTDAGVGLHTCKVCGSGGFTAKALQRHHYVHVAESSNAASLKSVAAKTPEATTSKPGSSYVADGREWRSNPLYGTSGRARALEANADVIYYEAEDDLPHESSAFRSVAPSTGSSWQPLLFPNMRAPFPSTDASATFGDLDVRDSSYYYSVAREPASSTETAILTSSSLNSSALSARFMELTRAVLREETESLNLPHSGTD